MRGRGHGTGWVALLVLAAGLLAQAATAAAGARPALRTVPLTTVPLRTIPLRTIRYHGYTVRIPRSWPVYDLGRDPAVCLRFDRHALYLGNPSPQQRCPAHAAGRTEAILVQPIASAAAGARAAIRLQGTAVTFPVPAAGVLVTATWSRQPVLVAAALGRRSLPPVAPTAVPAVHATTAGPRVHAATAGPRVHAAATGPRAHAAAAVYTGLGFDACAAPSASDMSAWQASPYRAIGIYIGGVNMACAQPNLTATWVSSEVVAGWQMIPTYVGLQAPHNGCGCASIDPKQAAAEGTAAASDAVTQAQALGIGAGNPIYYDMEAYPSGGSTTSTVLAFLSAWTSQLHADGYTSGVYSSADSGISDLVAASGTSFVEPDEIWIASWDDQHSTYSTVVPATDWADHQRLHQYSGAHNETYGHVKLNIDGDYLDGATADTGGMPPPSLTISPASDGTTNLYVSWNFPNLAASWRVLATDAATSTTLTTVAAARASGGNAQITLHSAAPYFAVQAVDTTGQVLSTSATVPTPSHVVIYTRSAFVPSGSYAFGGIPAGCYTGAPCHITTTISTGKTVIAKTGGEYVPAGAAGILYFRLTRQGRAMLAQAPGARLPVQVTLSDSSGATATRTLNLIPFTTSGRSQHRRLAQSNTLQILSLTDFVSAGGVGGIIAGCWQLTACHVSVTLSTGSTTLASAGPEWVGAEELGPVYFRLTPQARSRLAQARGNHISARLTVTDGTDTSSAIVSLVGFS